MTGTGPLGRDPAGTFNFTPPPPGQAMYMEPCRKWVRVELGGETIADSRRALLVSESGHQPVYYFPPEDVRADVLEPSDRHTHCPKKGEASYHTIRVGDQVVENGAWYYPEPLAGAEPIRDLIAFYWGRMDHWFEEDEEVFVHPRDPYHRVDVIPTSRHIRVSLDGEVLAETDRAMALFESNLPIRWYLPPEDVTVELQPTDTVTRCPYKGIASYYAVRRENGETVKDLIWHYDDPLPAVDRIAGRLCFFNERVDVEVDGETEGRPETPWQHGVKSEGAAIARSGS
ncbi:MAG: DUF427 domain-containing protein [Solirubrobacterales bacterium]|nr:DUF427 domain-containing protein [Solirubrobacterales bacterium]